MSELDKFKRRLIRSVARLLLQDKKPEDEVWDELKKETGCDCKLLWQRMRALTMKKLKRLLAADDRDESIATVARLSVTDWLLFDIVLAHEQFDVIGQDKISSSGVDSQPLLELFSLVQRYSIEGAHGAQLAERWSAAVVAYNSQGRHVSPMLLQRRWYQIKALARHNFYKLWFSYRGNQKLWSNAQQYRPTRLQMAIAKRYPHVITQSFPTWEEQIETSHVIQPEVFDEKMRMANLPKPCDDNDPDLLVLEPLIETIDLRVDSDSDDVSTQPDDADSQQAALKSGPSSIASPFTPDDDSNTMTSIDIDLSTVKTEPQEEIDGLSNVKILQPTHIPQETIESNTDVTNEEMLPNVKLEIEVEDPKETFKRNLLLNVNQFIESTQDMLLENDSTDIEAHQENLVSVPKPTAIGLTQTEQEILEEDESIETQVTENLHVAHRNLEEDDIIKEKDEQYFKAKIVATVAKIQNLGSDDIIRENSERFCKDKIVAAMSVTKDKNINPIIRIESDTSNSNIHEENDDTAIDDIVKHKADQHINKSIPAEESTTSGMQEDSDNSEVEDIIKQKADEFICKTDSKPVTVVDSFNLSHDIIIDDGIEFAEDGIEYLEEEDTNSKNGFSDKKLEKTNETTPKFDLKLLMKPIVYTMKLDSMAVLQGNDFESVYDKNVINSIVTESRPSLPTSKLAINNLQIKQENDVNQQIHLSDDRRIIDDLFTPLDPDDSINRQLNLSDDKRSNDDMFTPNDPNDSSEYESDTGISEDMKVKPTNYLLQKPRNRSYNPIQLCKNPDFNTRLKRLTVGFFISPRNRRLIKECKPMTIDVHKAFESKLVNGTLYLKSNDGAPQPIIFKGNDQNEQTAVVPSAMPVQSIIDNTIADVYNVNSTRSDETAERNKIINLPDISQIRRINQRLQTAEVTPIRVHNTTDARMPLFTPELINLSERDNNLLGDMNSQTPVNFQEPTDALMKSNLINTVETPEDSHINQSNEDANSMLSVGNVPSVSSQDIVIQQQSIEICNVKPNVNLPGNQTVINHYLPVDTSVANPTFKQNLIERPRKIGRPSLKMTTEKLKTPHLPMTYAKSSIISVPWNKAKKPPTKSNLDEFLITIDTLNKMINKMNGHDLYKNPNKKNKKQYWVIDCPANEKVLKSDKKAVTHEPTVTKNEPTVTKNNTPKQKTAVQKSQDEREKILHKKRKSRDCCWSKYRIEKLCLNKKFYKPHTCPLPTCNCCCRERLAVYRSGIANQRRQNGLDKCQTSIVLSDDEDDALRNACASIENVVQQASTPLPIVRVIPGDNSINSANLSTPYTQPMYIMAANNSESIYSGTSTKLKILPSPTAPNDSATNSGTGSTSVVDAAMMQHNTNVSSSSVVFSHSSGSPTSDIAARGLPLNVVNVSSIRSSAVADHQVQNNGAIVSTLIPEDTVPLIKRPRGRPRRNKMYVPIHCTENTPSSTEAQANDLPIPQNDSDSPPLITSKQAKQRQFTLMAMDTYQRKLVIDGSKKCPITRKVIHENSLLKNNVLDFNVSNKSAGPISLGKNQILLTTVKFPRVQVPAVEKPPETAVIPTSPLPTGVQLLLLPNGELTYSVDPGVQLDSEQLSALPAIIATIQQQISVAPLQTVNKDATSTPDEVIKLSDDENTLPSDQNGAKKSISRLSTNQDKISVPVEGNQECDILSSIQEEAVDQSKPTKCIPDVESVKGAGNESGSAIDSSINTENQSYINAVVTTENRSKSIVDNQVDNVETQLPVSVTSIKANKNNSELSIENNITEESVTVNECKELNKCNKNVEISNKEADGSEVETSNKNNLERANEMDPTEESSTENEFKESNNGKENVETNNKQSDDCIDMGTSRNLLSDLMEMSGISAEDTKFVPQESTSQEVVASRGSSAAEALLSPKTVQKYTTNSQIMNFPELTAVTSLAELKYACENNGKFFRLDLNTGVIGALNVCIKKSLKKPRKVETTPTVVDLTDDAESHFNEKVDHREKYATSTSNEPQEAEVVKPVKLFKAVHKLIKTINKIPILNRKAFGPQYTFVNSKSLSNDKIRIKQKRKQSLDKIEAKIDLVDSDAPMEEEYLVENSDSDDEYTVTYDKQNNNDLNNTGGPSDDSSDDEPLAKKAKRIRRDNLNKLPEEKVGGGMENAGKETEILEDIQSKGIVTNVAVESSTNISDADMGSELLSTEMDADNLDTVGGDSQVDFMENEDSDSQEDCILGV